MSSKQYVGNTSLTVDANTLNSIGGGGVCSTEIPRN